MKSRYSLAIVTSSELLRSGLKGLLRDMRGVSFDISYFSSDDDIDDIMGCNPTIVIADTGSFSIRDIKSLRDAMSSKVSVCGVCVSALADEYLNSLDGLISLYDSAERVQQLILRCLSAINRDEQSLTPREREIVIGVVKGLSNKQIAAANNLSVNTVMTHRRNIAAKLQIHSAAGLTIYALMNKLVQLDDVAT